MKEGTNISVICKCGTELHVNLGDWQINIIGMLEFVCPNCNTITRTSALLKHKDNVYIKGKKSE